MDSQSPGRSTQPEDADPTNDRTPLSDSQALVEAPGDDTEANQPTMILPVAHTWTRTDLDLTIVMPTLGHAMKAMSEGAENAELGALAQPTGYLPVAEQPVDRVSPHRQAALDMSQATGQAIWRDLIVWRQVFWRELVRRRQVHSWRSLQARRYSLRAVAVLGVLGVLIGFCATQGALNTLDAIRAARNAKAEATAIEAILKSGSFLDTQTLEDLQVRFDTLSVDMERIQAAIPAESALATAPGVSGPIHVIRMASDLVNAGQYGVAAALILIPRLKGALATIGGGQATTTPSASASPTPTTPTTGAPTPGALTLDELNQAIGDINIAVALVKQAVAERAGFTDHDLSLVGLSSLLPTIHKLDPLLPQLPQEANTVQGLVNSLPSLLGFDKTRNYLLFEMDSDELRATGGFQGNYGILTFTNSKLVSGVHLHDTRNQLDCPHSSCPHRLVPSQFADWFVTAPTQFALRDANLDPNFPATALTDESLYATETGGQTVDGVIAVTPAVIERILALTGPITVTIPDTSPAQKVTVNAQNLQDQIHLFHTANDGNIAVNTDGTTSRKAIDTVLGSALLHDVGHLSASKQKALIKALQDALLTHDIQVYFNNATAENALLAFRLGAALQSPPNTDTLMVNDFNFGGSYANQDVTEHITDTVTLDAQGNATHDLKIAYVYPVIHHLYDQVTNVVTGQIVYWPYWTYKDYVRVITPKRSILPQSYQGCANNEPTTEANFQVMGCPFEIDRNGVKFPNNQTLEFVWKVPAAATHVSGGWQYQLLMQRQAGSRVVVTINIVLPKGAHFTATPTTPLKAGSATQSPALATATTDLPKDTTYTVLYH